MPMPTFHVHVTWPANHKFKRLAGRTETIAHAMGGVPMNLEDEQYQELLAKHIHDHNLYPGAEKIEIEKAPVQAKDIGDANRQAILATPMPTVRRENPSAAPAGTAGATNSAISGAVSAAGAAPRPGAPGQTA